MKIINHGKLYRVPETLRFTCWHCDCTFEEKVPAMRKYDDPITCPECGIKIIVAEGKVVPAQMSRKEKIRSWYQHAHQRNR